MAQFVGLRFLLQQGSYLQVVVEEAEAKQIIHGWLQGTLNVSIGGTNQFGSWAIRTSTVQGIHTIPLTTEQGYPPALQTAWRGSGLS